MNNYENDLQKKDGENSFYDSYPMSGREKKEGSRIEKGRRMKRFRPLKEASLMMHA